MNIDQLKQFFKNNTFTEPIVIRQCETIKNPSKTSEGLIYLLDRRGTDGAYVAYYNTLVEIYKKLK